MRDRCPATARAAVVPLIGPATAMTPTLRTCALGRVNPAKTEKPPVTDGLRHPLIRMCCPSPWDRQAGQTAAMALASRSRTWPATACSAGFSMACIDATGSIALTSTPPSIARRITLQGNMAPTLGSIPMAR